MSERSQVLERQTVRDAAPAYQANAPEIAQNDVPPGYKQIEAGVIPEDWVSIRLGDAIDLLTGFPFSSSGFSDNGALLVRGSNVKRGKLDWDEEITKYWRTITPELFPYKLEEGDLVIAMDGALVGRSFAVISGADLPALLVQRVARIRSNRVDQRLIVHWVASDYFVAYVDSVKTHTAIPHISPGDIRGFPIYAPRSRAEQRAIATALSDGDALIKSLDRLIAKKRAIKQAAMQQLLTGQTRLPGFTGEWETKWLGDHLIFLKTGTNSRSELSGNGSVGYLHYGDIHVGAGARLDPNTITMPRIESSKVRHLSQLKRGDLVFVDASEDLEGVGKSVEISDVPRSGMVAGLHTIAARFDKAVLADGFKAYLQFCPVFIGTLRRLAAGTKVLATNRRHVASVEMALPDVSEQEAIAAVLSDMDTEIETLANRRDKARHVKQGMMQQLLTGQVRLVNSVDLELPESKLLKGRRRANVHFMRSVFAAEIVDQLHQEPTFGHVKLQKVLFLAEHLCDVDTGSTYHRKAAGPYDNRALRSIDSQLQKQQWFEARREDGRYRYVPLDKRGKHKEYFDRYFSREREPFQEIVETFRRFDTERCEIVATLFAAWDDLLREQETVTDEMIIHEVLNNWHESKNRIPKDRWSKALSWMREKGFVPKRRLPDG